MEKMSKKNRTAFRYTLAGVLFGAAFPLAATLLEVFLRRQPAMWASIVEAQRTTPLLWIIDSAPIFLGVFAYMAGSRQQKLEEQASRLEELVETRSKEIIRQKLFYEALVHNNPIAIVTMDQNQRIISINPAFQEIFGFHLDEIMGKDIDALIANPERTEDSVKLTQEVMSGKGIHTVGKRRQRDGGLVDVEIFGEPILVNGNQIGVLGLYRDITFEKQAQEAICASEERFRRMFRDSPVALRMEDFSAVRQWLEEKQRSIQGSLADYLQQNPEEFRALSSLATIVDLNDASLMLFKARDMEELQRHLHSILSSESKGQAIKILMEMLNGATSLEREMIYQRLDGRQIHTIMKLSVVPGYEQSWERVLFSNMDITERKLAEERLTYISLHDIMTGLYNRAFFEEEIKRLEKSRQRPISIMVADMDNLKIINDRHGHQAGDIALQNLADIFRHCFRAEDMVARIGGDEIAVLLPGANAEITEKARQRLQECMAEYNLGNAEGIPLSVSIGCATAEQGESLELIFKTADENMYLEKQKKKEKG
jgi:diguanylate cyclase (GGDEF)-like protein/PAS domain S-box-containing protein